MKLEELENLLIEWLIDYGYGHQAEEAKEIAERAFIEYDAMGQTIKVTYANGIEETFKIATRKVLTK